MSYDKIAFTPLSASDLRERIRCFAEQMGGDADEDGELARIAAGRIVDEETRKLMSANPGMEYCVAMDHVLQHDAALRVAYATGAC